MGGQELSVLQSRGREEDMKSCCWKRLMAGLLTMMLLASSGCGYFLYPERVGQTEGRVDPAVVVLDAAGLLFGIVPGVIAFAVDITTGTIYLPAGEENVLEKHQERLSSFDTPMQPVAERELDLDREQVAQALTALVAQPVDPDQIRYYQAANQSRIIARSTSR